MNELQTWAALACLLVIWHLAIVVTCTAWAAALVLVERLRNPEARQ